MGDSRAKTLNVSILSWALRGAARYAVAVAILALTLSLFLPDTEAERFATAAYLAAIFTAIVLALKLFVPQPPAQPSARLVLPSFPALLGYALAVTILLTAAAGFAGDSGAELHLILYCLAVVGIAAIGRGGALAWLHAELTRGGRLQSTIVYAVVVAAGALVLGALLPSELTDVFAKVAYAAAAVAAVVVASLLVVPTPLGALLRSISSSASRSIEHLSGDLVFARTTDAAVVVLVTSLAMASMLRRPYAEPFAATAYAAALVATLGVGMECRRRLIHPSSTIAEPARYLQSVADVTATTVERLSRVFTFENLARLLVWLLTLEGTICSSAGAAVAAWFVASLLSQPYAESFAVIGYLAAVVSTIGIVLQCRRTIQKRSVATQ